jgi:predicted GNAT superfamily acetyltransferase
VYEDVKEGHDYVITVDVARGVGEDYSAFMVVDITEFPHKVVAKYRNNEIKPMLFPNIIYDVAKNYNGAYILCEVNDIGDQVASLLHYDLEYQNVLMCSMRGRAVKLLVKDFLERKLNWELRCPKLLRRLVLLT